MSHGGAGRPGHRFRQYTTWISASSPMSTSLPRPHISILGGGPAGLSAAYHARQNDLPFTLYEAGSDVGGNCRTLDFAGHRFDTGAHRLHEDDPNVTAEIRSLLGGRMLTVDAPSQIFVRGRLIDFPLSPLGVLRSLDAGTLARAALDKLRAVRRSAPAADNFQEFAERQYGKTLADLLLLSYSEKLWGVSADELSVSAAGGRLKGLDVKTFLLEAVLGRRAKTRHLDGRFFYPEDGYGAIMDALARSAGPDGIHCGARVTALRHDRSRIRRIDIDGASSIDVDAVVSTLPLPVAVRILRPAPPPEVAAIADRLRFRHLRLIVLVLGRERFSPNASLYFPDAAVPFTRIYEPKNRSERLSPPGETCVVVEIPCSTGDDVAVLPDYVLADRVVRDLTDRRLLRPAEVRTWRALTVPNAYPVLEVGFEDRVARLAAYLDTFINLYLVGRSARFEYSHFHRIFTAARSTIDTVQACSNLRTSVAVAA